MPARPRAVLVGVQTPDLSLEELQSSLAELERLVDTLGLDTVGQVTQKRGGTGSSNLLGDGKLEELAAWTGGTGVVAKGPRKKKKDEEEEEDLDDLVGVEVGAADEDPWSDEAPAPQTPAELRRADVVVVDAELSPSQLRNLGSAAGVEVLDRTGVILEIFHRHARSREARLQVEIARLAYLAPRLRETGATSERRAGKGAGESDIEIDRRRVRDRMAQLRRELADLETESGSRRSRRHRARQVALVGYTNAGKSSLTSALTSSEVYIADRLFATLDTTVRRLSPGVVPPILVTDTVGFIRDLPHGLVASFRSTLDAALEAQLLLQVVDAADADFQRQLDVTTEVLREIEADDIPRVVVFNKCDRLSPERLTQLAEEWPDAWFTSAKDPARVAELHARIVTHFAAGLEEAELFVPWARSSAIGAIRGDTEVLDERYEDDGVRYVVRGTSGALARIRASLADAT